MRKFAVIIALVFLVSATLHVAEATVYQTSVNPGYYMKYRIKHSPDYEGAFFRVQSVTNTTLTMNYTLTLTNKTLVNGTITLSVAKAVNTNLTKPLLKEITEKGWTSFRGDNSVSIKGDELEFRMKPNERGTSEMEYTFPKAENFTELRFISLQMALDDKADGERFFLGLEDEKGKTVFYELVQMGVFNPRTRKHDYVQWEEKVITLPSQTEKAKGPMNFSAVKALSFAYVGNSTKVLRVKEVLGLQRESISHSLDFLGYPLYLVISRSLVAKDQLYPDLTQTIEKESEIVSQNTRRKALSSRSTVFSQGFTFLTASYTWDAETGILVSSSSFIGGRREVELVETNAWGPENFLAYLAVTLQSSFASYWSVAGGATTVLITVWFVGFVLAILYDKWKRNELRELKQWLPFLFILIIASLVSFFLLQIIPRLGLLG